jgi:hypothetical protein
MVERGSGITAPNGNGGTVRSPAAAAAEKFYRHSLRWTLMISLAIQAMTIFVVWTYSNWVTILLKTNSEEVASMQRQMNWITIEMWILGSEVRGSTDTLVKKQSEFTKLGQERIIENHQLVMEVQQNVDGLANQIDKFEKDITRQLEATKAYTRAVKQKVEAKIVNPSDVAGIKQENRNLERKYQKVVKKKAVNTFRYPWEPRVP